MLDTKTIYYVDYLDMNDGWLGFEYINEFRQDRVFDDYDEALDCQKALNDKLAFGNVRCGEYYDVKSTAPSQAPEAPVWNLTE